jgi:RimJ/RimL family protein N-acetyltransferase
MDSYRVLHYPTHLSARDMRFIWDLMAAEGSQLRVFPDGNVRDGDDLADFMDQPGRHFYAVRLDAEPIGFFWLEILRDRVAMIHVCGFRPSFRAHTLPVGRAVLDWLLTGDGTEPFMDVVIAVMDESNSMARRYARALGFHEMGVIPKVMTQDCNSTRGVALAWITKEDIHG